MVERPENNEQSIFFIISFMGNAVANTNRMQMIDLMTMMMIFRFMIFLMIIRA